MSIVVVVLILGSNPMIVEMRVPPVKTVDV